MSERPHKRNWTPPGTKPRTPKAPHKRPGRGRAARGYDAERKVWKAK